MKYFLLFSKQIKLLAVLIFGLFLFFSCNKDDANNPDTIKLSEVFNALGGESNIKNITAISYQANGDSFEYEQDGPNVTKPINGNNYRYNYASILNQRKVKLDYDYINFLYPFTYNTSNAKITINDKHGTISGQFNWSSFYLGWSTPTALYSGRIEAVLKNQLMANPIELVKYVYLKNGINKKSENNSFYIETIVDNIKIELQIDSQTKLPTRAIVTELDFLNGDSPFEVEYLNWITIDGIKFPSKLNYKLNNRIIKSETLSNIVLNPTFSENTFELENADLLSYNINQAKKGVISSQWYHRLFAGGIPQDQPLDNGAVLLEEYDLSPFGMGNQQVSSNIKIIGRPDSSNWPVAIITNSGIHLVESPLSPDWTKSVFNVLKYKYPEQTIKSLIPTHTHYDHFSGIKEAASQVEKIYIAHNGRESLDRALSNTNTVFPDAFSVSSNVPQIEEVSNVTYIDNGAIEVHLLKLSDNLGNPFTVKNSHSEDIVVVYVPSEQTLIQADFLYCGVFIKIFNGESVNPFTGPARLELKDRALFLRNYIQEKGLNVTKIIGIHGGLATMQDLIDISND